MRTHLDRPLRMSQLAAMANISAAHFTELFKAHIGYSPKDYFTRLQMHKASQLLENSNLTVKEIAYQVGYEDPLHFSRVFKRINELSPTDQRKRDKG
jgi:transcriptional regulator GlxA family with amidase domain